MNGATADAPPKTIKIPSNNKRKIVGKSHHFFRAFKNFQRSVKKSMFILFLS